MKSVIDLNIFELLMHNYFKVKNAIAFSLLIVFKYPNKHLSCQMKAIKYNVSHPHCMNHCLYAVCCAVMISLAIFC